MFFTVAMVTKWAVSTVTVQNILKKKKFIQIIKHIERNNLSKYELKLRLEVARSSARRGVCQIEFEAEGRTTSKTKQLEKMFLQVLNFCKQTSRAY